MSKLLFFLLLPMCMHAQWVFMPDHFKPNHLPGLELDLNAEDPDGDGIDREEAHGTVINTIRDCSGNGRDYSCYGNPTLLAGVINGYPSIDFDANDFARHNGPTSTEYNFLHTGDWTIYVVGETQNPGQGKYTPVFTTASSWTEKGVFISLEQRGGGSYNNPNQGVYMAVLNGANRASVVNGMTASNIFSYNTPTIWTFSADISTHTASVYINGDPKSTTCHTAFTNCSAPPNSGNFSEGPTISALNTTTAYGNLKLTRMLIFSEHHNDATRQKVERYLKKKYGI